jgi:RimJ/RimL family protein N-acetyltransferase
VAVGKLLFTLFVYRFLGVTSERSMLLGSRISIGPFVPEDFAAMFCWFNDVAAAGLDLAYRPVDMMAHQQWWQSLGRDQSKVVFAIRKLSEPVIIGYVQIAAINSVHRSAEIGIRIGEEKNRGQGYGSEALRLALDFCWNHLNLNRLQLTVFKHNLRAIGAYRAAGFCKEGRMRKAAFIGGKWADLIMMAALRPAQKRSRRLSGATAATATSAPDLRSFPRTAAA